MEGGCTDIEPLKRLPVGLNLNRKAVAVGGMGARFILDVGIHPTVIAM
jgi:hypothetical protein